MGNPRRQNNKPNIFQLSVSHVSVSKDLWVPEKLIIKPGLEKRLEEYSEIFDIEYVILW